MSRRGAGALKTCLLVFVLLGRLGIDLGVVNLLPLGSVTVRL